MADISIPHSLTQAEAVISLSSLLQKLMDVNERKSLADDIKAFHALNDTEAKKAQEARDLIKSHAETVEKIRATSLANKQASDSLSIERTVWEQKKMSEQAAIEEAKNNVASSLADAHALAEAATQMQNDLAVRESALEENKGAHAENVRKLLSDQNKLAEERQSLEAQKRAILDLDKDVKAKVEALKKFNF